MPDPMLEVQRLLRGGRPLADVAAEYSLKVTEHPTDARVILGYSQIDSDKRAQVVRECRGLVLERGSWDVVARPFFRFHNAGECPDLEKDFDWGDFVAEEKHDGSLILLYEYGNRWCVNTKGSFAQGEICPGAGKTWEQAFHETGINIAAGHMNTGWTFLFELCTPWNKVVVDHPKPKLFLLSAFQNENGSEADSKCLDDLGESLGVYRPDRWNLLSLDHAVKAASEYPGGSFEGFVLRDKNGMRLKVKNADYVRLHHLKGNGNLFLDKNIIPFVLKGEEAEVLNSFPESAEKVFGIVERLGAAEARMLAVWERAKGIDSQKDFALFVTKHTRLSSVLFQARKAGRDPRQVLRESEDLVVKQLAC
jgi:hypothetical protein